MRQLPILWLVIINCVAFYTKNGNIIELTTDNFDKLVIDSDEVWIVTFFAPWCKYSQNLIPEYTKAAGALKGIIKVGAVDVEKFKDLANNYKIQDLPKIYIFGSNKNQPLNYEGKRTAKNLAETALKAVHDEVNKAITGKRPSSKSDSTNTKEFYLNSENVRVLTDSNFENVVLESDDLWLINFYAPWCGHCKNFAPSWVKIAEELQHKIKLGVVDATLHQRVSEKYDIRKYPSVKFFAPKVMNSPIDYDRSHTTSDVIQWALEKINGLSPRPEIIQIVDENSYKAICEDKPLCVFLVLPHILDCQSDCRNSYLELVGHLAEQFKQYLWGWAWSEGGAQPHLENALSIGGFGYPALAVINVKKLKYTLFKGAFSEKPIYMFLRDVAYAKGTSYLLQNRELLDIVMVKNWDGKDLLLSEEQDNDETLDPTQKDEL